jgi:Na+/proline symporter
MVTNDATLVRLKHRIMEETARLAWDGKLDEENKEKLIYEIIPGFAAGLIAAVAVSLATKAPSADVTAVFDKVASGEEI